MTFVDFYISPRMVQLRKLHSVTLTYSLKVNNFENLNIKYHETVRVGAKKVWRDFQILTILH